jgi:hypothetical protein
MVDLFVALAAGILQWTWSHACTGLATSASRSQVEVIMYRANPVTVLQLDNYTTKLVVRRKKTDKQKLFFMMSMNNNKITH